MHVPSYYFFSLLVVPNCFAFMLLMYLRKLYTLILATSCVDSQKQETPTYRNACDVSDGNLSDKFAWCAYWPQMRLKCLLFP